MNLDLNPSLLDSVQGSFYLSLSFTVRIYVVSYSTVSLWKAENF